MSSYNGNNVFMYTKHCQHCGNQMRFVAQWKRDNYTKELTCNKVSTEQAEVFPYPTELKTNTYLVGYRRGKNINGIFPVSIYCQCGKIHRTKTFAKILLDR